MMKFLCLQAKKYTFEWQVVSAVWNLVENCSFGDSVLFLFTIWNTSGVPRGGVVGFKHPPPTLKFLRPSKIVSNSTQLWKMLKMLNLGRQHPKMFGKKGSKILKLQPVRNCFTLAITNKLIVIMNSLKVSKIKKILLYEMKILVPNYSCLQNPWLGDNRPQTPVLSVLCPQLNLSNPSPPEQNSCVRHCGARRDGTTR
jgi:hypothetical protein